MGKKLLLWTGIAIFVLWFIKATGLIAAAAMFLLAGIIPGTSISIPPIPMLILLGIALILTGFWIRKQRLATQLKQLKANHAASTQKSPSSKSVRKKAATKKSVNKKKKATSKTIAAQPRRRFTSVQVS